MQKPSNHLLDFVALRLSVATFLSSNLPSWNLSRLNLVRKSEALPDGKPKKKLSLLSLEKDVTTLNTSFSIEDSIRRLRRRKWSVFDIQYLVLASITISCLWIIEPAAPILKTAAFLGYMLLLLMPATNQFFLPSWPIWVYLLFFFSSRYVPLKAPLEPITGSHPTCFRANI